MAVLRQSTRPEPTAWDVVCHQVCEHLTGWGGCVCAKAASRPCAAVEARAYSIAALIREHDKAEKKAAKIQKRQA
jgi:hypothetical protein